MTANLLIFELLSVIYIQYFNYILDPARYADKIYKW